MNVGTNGQASLHLSTVILHHSPMLADGIVEALRLQAHFSGEFDSPMYGNSAPLRDDVEQGGRSPRYRRVGGQADATRCRCAFRRGPSPRPRRQGAGLAAFYPTVGGTPGGQPWNAFRDVLVQHAAFIRIELDRQVQTNEVRRSTALLGGFLTIAAATGKPLRLRIAAARAQSALGRYRYELLFCQPQTAPAADAPIVRTGARPTRR